MSWTYSASRDSILTTVIGVLVGLIMYYVADSFFYHARLDDGRKALIEIVSQHFPLGTNFSTSGGKIDEKKVADKRVYTGNFYVKAAFYDGHDEYFLATIVRKENKWLGTANSIMSETNEELLQYSFSWQLIRFARVDAKSIPMI